MVFGLQNSGEFVKAVRCLTNSVSGISNEDVALIYRRFLVVLEKNFSKTMNRYWKEHDKKSGNWHFIRRSDKIRSYTGNSSKIVGGIMDRQSRFPFMDS